MAEFRSQLDALEEKQSLMKDKINDYEFKYNTWKENERKKERLEKLVIQSDDSLPAEYPDYENLNKELTKYKNELKYQKEQVEETIKLNNNIIAHNNKVKVLSEQKTEYTELENVLQEKLDKTYKTLES